VPSALQHCVLTPAPHVSANMQNNVNQNHGRNHNKVKFNQNPAHHVLGTSDSVSAYTSRSKLPAPQQEASLPLVRLLQL
jgi:hypothetical protein